MEYGFADLTSEFCTSSDIALQFKSFCWYSINSLFNNALESTEIWRRLQVIIQWEFSARMKKNLFFIGKGTAEQGQSKQPEFIRRSLMLGGNISFCF